MKKMSVQEIMGNWNFSFAIGEVLKNGTALNGQETAVAASAAVAGLLICLLGLKIVRVWAALFGFAAGFLAGTMAADMAGLTLAYDWIPGVVTGAVLAGLAAGLYRFGIFVTVWASAGLGCAYLIGPDDPVSVLICTAAGLIAALLTVKFKEIVTILFTAVFGALTAGVAAAFLITDGSELVFGITAAVSLIAGILVQLLLESKKRKRASLKKAEEIRKTHSTANEVERARAMMENLDRLDEDGYGDDEDQEFAGDDDDYDDEFEEDDEEEKPSR